MSDYSFCIGSRVLEGHEKEYEEDSGKLNSVEQKIQSLREGLTSPLPGITPTVFVGQLLPSNFGFERLKAILEDAELATIDKEGNCIWNSNTDKTLVQMGVSFRFDRQKYLKEKQYYLPENTLRSLNCLKQLEDQAQEGRVVRILSGNENLEYGSFLLESVHRDQSKEEVEFLKNFVHSITSEKWKRATLIDEKILVSMGGVTEEHLERILMDLPVGYQISLSPAITCGDSQIVTKKIHLDFIERIKKCNLATLPDQLGCWVNSFKTSKDRVYSENDNKKVFEVGEIKDRFIQVINTPNICTDSPQPNLGHQVVCGMASDILSQPQRTRGLTCQLKGRCLFRGGKDELTTQYLEYTKDGMWRIGCVKILDPNSLQSTNSSTKDGKMGTGSVEILDPNPLQSTNSNRILKIGFALSAGIFGLERLLQSYSDMKNKKFKEAIANFAFGAALTASAGYTAIKV